MNISTNIKVLRDIHKLSQDELGKIAGVSDKAVSTWENGSKVPRMGAIQKIATYFNIKTSDIIDGDVKKALNKSSEPTAIDPLDEKILELFAQLTPENKEIFLGKLVQTLASQDKK